MPGGRLWADATTDGPHGNGKQAQAAPIPNTFDRLALLFDWVEQSTGPPMQ